MEKKKSTTQSSSKSTAPLLKGIERIKILSMGPNGCGKSCLIKRYCEERFISKYIATIGVDYGVKAVKLDDQEVRVNFWDLSGFNEFFEIRNEFYKDSQGCLLVFDVCNRDTFSALDTWLAEFFKYGGTRDIPLVLCGNKIDKKREVSIEEARNFAKSRGLKYYDVSALSGENVQDMFMNLFQRAYNRSKGIPEIDN